MMRQWKAVKLKFAAYWNSRAFTLIEVLLALTIFTTISFFMTPIFKLILDQTENHVKLQAMEWEVFSGQFKKEIQLTTNARVESGQLLLTKETETVIYEKYNSNLRRQVNKTGHEIVLQNVSNYSFEILHNAVKVTVFDLWGREYSVIAYSLVEWETGR